MNEALERIAQAFERIADAQERQAAQLEQMTEWRQREYERLDAWRLEDKAERTRRDQVELYYRVIMSELMQVRVMLEVAKRGSEDASE